MVLLQYIIYLLIIACLKLDSGDIELVYDWFKINILIMKLLFSYLFDCLLFAIVY